MELYQAIIIYLVVACAVYGLRTARKYRMPSYQDRVDNVAFDSKEYKYNSGVAVFWPLCFLGIILRDLCSIVTIYIKSFKEIS